MRELFKKDKMGGGVWGSAVMGVSLLFLLTGTVFSFDQVKHKDVPVEDVESEKSGDVLPAESEASVESISSEESTVEEPVAEDVEPDAKLASKDIVAQAWKANAEGDGELLKNLITQCTEHYGEEAVEQHASLTDFPFRDKIELYQSYNDVCTCMFIEAEYEMYHTLDKARAIELLERNTKECTWAQAWDPSRGSFWKIAEKSQAAIDVLTGKTQSEMDRTPIERNLIFPEIHTKGGEDIVDYTQFGLFEHVGTSKYRYRMTNVEGLAAAVGEGIYPNTGDIYKNPRYKAAKEAGRLDMSHWDLLQSDDLEAAYFKWFTAPEPWGVRLFYVGLIFEKAGMWHEALRTYHALIVHYPKTVAWTYWQTPWYPAQAAIAKIRHIIRTNPGLQLEDRYMKIQILKGFDNDVANDEFIVFPGKIIKKGFIQRVKDKVEWDDDVELTDIKQSIGSGHIKLVQFGNDHWQLQVNGEPFVIKGMNYVATKIGQTPDRKTLANWMFEDENENGKPDGPYDSYVDVNLNDHRDEDEPIVGDFQLMKDMGVNAVRIYHDPDTPNKELLRELHSKYGIYVIMSDFLGKYAIGSGADWDVGTDYENLEHKKNMLASVQKMVEEHKDEPYVLMWLLGNENNYGVASNADKKPKEYFEFVDEVARWIKTVDTVHPVAVSNGDTLFLDVFAEYAPNIDIYAANIYRGDYGFGSFWEQVMDASGKPAFITEYGCPAYAAHMSLEEAEQAQSDYLLGNWMDIEENTAGYGRGSGNALGGVLFQWMDEWWKNYEPYLHDHKADTIGPFPGGYYFEEWFGIMSQGNGHDSPYLRQPRKAYDVYKSLWNK